MPKATRADDLPGDHEALTELVKRNALAVRQTQRQVQGEVGRETILEILREGRSA